MKQVFSILMFLVVAIGFSQTTLKELVEWHERPIEEIKHHFLDAKWLLVNDSYSEQYKAGQINFTSTERPDKNTVNLDIFHESGAPSQTRLFLRTKNKQWFDSLKTEVDALGFAFVSREVVSGNTSLKYTDKKTTILFITERPVGAASAYYQVWVMSNSFKKPNRYNLTEE